MALTMDPRIGSVLAGYRVEALLGRGGMGVVYLAQDLSLERRVALKLLAPELLSEEGFRERFLRESRLAASIDHPNVIPIYEAGEFEGALFIAMRYVEGSDLKRLLEQERLEPALAIALLSQVAEALDVAHEHGLVHRDVKPSNVLVATQGGREHVYLADFGLSRRLAVAGSVERSHFSGSADYVAPEQVQRKPLDGRADLYALGCVLYECLSGRPPLQRDTIPATLFAHLEDDPPPASQTDPDLPPEIDGVLARALAKEPEQRQSSCGQLIDEARDALGITAPRTGWRHLHRRTKLALALVLVAGAAAIVAATVLSTRGSPTPRGSGPTTRITGDSLQRIDPKTNALSATVVGVAPPEDDKSDVAGHVSGEYLPIQGTGLAAGEGAVWVFDRTSQTVLRIDPKNVLSGTTPAVGGYSSAASEDRDASGGVSAGLGGVWVVSSSGTLVRMDPDTGLLASQIPFPEDIVVESVVVGYGAVWVSAAGPAGSTLWRLDPETGRVIDTGMASGIELAAGEDAIWTGPTVTYTGSTASALDPATNKFVYGISLPFDPTGLAAGEGGVWVSDGLGDTVWQLHPVHFQVVRQIHVGDDPTGVVASDGSVWVANSGDGTVSRIDPKTGKIVATIEVGGHPDDIAVGEGGVWVTVHPE